MRAGRYWMRLSRFLMIAACWSTSRAARLPRPSDAQRLDRELARSAVFRIRLLSVMGTLPSSWPSARS